MLWTKVQGIGAHILMSRNFTCNPFFRLKILLIGNMGKEFYKFWNAVIFSHRLHLSGLLLSQYLKEVISIKIFEGNLYGFFFCIFPNTFRKDIYEKTSYFAFSSQQIQNIPASVVGAHPQVRTLLHQDGILTGFYENLCKLSMCKASLLLCLCFIFTCCHVKHH